MKAAILFTGGGPLAVVTAYQSLQDPNLLERLHEKGIDKFMAFELPMDTMRRAYGGHVDSVLRDNKQTDELRIVDQDGGRIFKMVPFADFGALTTHEIRSDGPPPPDPAAMI